MHEITLTPSGPKTITFPFSRTSIEPWSGIIECLRETEDGQQNMEPLLVKYSNGRRWISPGEQLWF